jgi:hypothetical protein
MLYIHKKNKEEKNQKIPKNTQDFSVCCSLSGVDFYVFIGGIFLVLFMLYYFRNGIFSHNFDSLWLYINGFISCGGLPLWFTARMWRLDVKGNEMRYRTFWGYSKKGQVHTISKIEETNNSSLIIYTREKRFGKINRDFIGIDNFLARCKEDGIEIIELPHTQKERKRTLTKFRMFLDSMMGLIVVGIIMVVIMGVMLLFLGGNYTIGEWVAVLLFIFAIPIFPSCFLPLKGLMQIVRQEQALGISFAEEMKRYNVKNSYFINEEWYIDSSMARMVAFRRDYVKSISEVSYHNYNPRSKYNDDDVCWVMVSTTDGGLIKVKSTYKTLVDLRLWSLGTMPGRDTLVKIPPNLMLEEITKALDAQDREGIKELFAKALTEEIEDFDQQVEELCSYYQGKMIIYDGKMNEDESVGQYTIFTNKKNYRIRYEYQSKGISSLETGLCKIVIGPHMGDQENDLDDLSDQDMSQKPGIYIQE